MDDVIVVGGGPAGAMAATLLGRAGARVRVFERARFPRPKLCGDTLNPGALQLLADHFSLSSLLPASLALDGMLLTGPGGVRVRGHYGAGVVGRAVLRRDLDAWLLRGAADAGAVVEEGTSVSGAIVDSRSHVCGVSLTGGVEHRARLVIAADGRASRLSRAFKLGSHPTRPRRWAIGGYFEGVADLSTLGEMHVRRGHYIGVAPVPGGIANACLVVPHSSGDAPWSNPATMLVDKLAADPELGPRFAGARLIERPSVLGPMAIDASAAGVPGLLLAGDAAGFIDPMTGDGLRFALTGGLLVAAIATDVLAGRIPITCAAQRLTEQRRAAFGMKWRFNRTLRALVASPRAVTTAAVAANLLPAAFEAIIRYAGDTDYRSPRARHNALSV